MKNRKYFSLGVYKEMLRQLSVAGVIGLAIALIIAVSPVLSTYTDGNPRIMTISEVCAATKVICDIAAPLLAFLAFSYGNKRKNSDFFHSLPYTRECVYLSIYGAVMTWILIIAAASMTVSVISRCLFPDEYIIIFAQLPVAFLSVISSAMLAVSAVALAASLTGTALMTVVVSGIILVVPGAVSGMLAEGVASRLPILADGYLGISAPQQYNLYYGSLGYLVGNSDIRGLVPVAYTLGVAVLYGILACVAFKKRKSETSHNSSVSSLWQNIFRIAFIIPFIMFPIMDIVNDDFEAAHLLWWLFCIVAYFAFELITTKKWKNLLRAIPGLFIAVCICVLCTFAVIVFANKAESFAPEASEIESVRIVGDTNSISRYSNSQLDYFDYAINKASKVKLTDEKAKEIISRSIADTKKRHAGYGDYDVEYKNLMVAVKAGGGEKYRWIFVREEDYEALVDILGANEEYRTAFMTYPEVSVGVSNNHYSYNYGSTRVDDVVLDTLAEEMAGLDFGKWFRYLEDGYGYNDEIVIVTKEGINSRAVVVPLKAHILPETFYLIKTKNLDSQFNRDECADVFEEIERVKGGNTKDMAYESRSYEVSAQAYIKTEDGVVNVGKSWFGIAYILEENDLEDFFDKDFESLSKMISKTRNKDLDLESFVEVSYTVSDKYELHDSVTAYYSIPEEYVEDFLDWQS
ncbi:MAG: hypothetical protein E7660_04645 [Ruminococcaceae bacterium]|nr:hypothetical protein [Oscillospiraceae bacterium]